MIDAVLNELSISQTNNAHVLVNDLVTVLLKARRLGGGLQLRIGEHCVDRLLAQGCTLRLWCFDQQISRQAGGRERQQFLKNHLTKLRFIDSKDPPNVLEKWNQHNSATEARLDVVSDQEALGALAAYLLDALLISLCTSNNWDAPHLNFTMSYLDSDSGVIKRKTKLRNASQLSHLSEHETWIKTRDPVLGDFRCSVIPENAQYVAASEYKKHVEGGSNAKRKKCAQNNGVGQYLAELDGVTVTDEVIKKWEQASLTEALDEGIHNVEKHGTSTFFVYAVRNHIVGYTGGSGHETTGMRVEWSSGHVHSHPRETDN